ncbi:MAG: formylglycine-generating enzyme family protein [Balneola sp.]
MVLIEGGSFIIGDIFDGENTDALPTHVVTVGSFYIGKAEVTFSEYDAFAETSGRTLPDDQGYGRGERAVVNIDWDDAIAFCKSLGFRLPTEAEWEYAARSGGKKQLYSGTSNPDSLKMFAITRPDNINFSFLVAKRKPNELGLYDMSGNVFEWVDEFYQFYSMPDQLHDHKNDGIRIIRGGSFGEQTSTTRTYWRTGTLRDVKANDLGFRCAK